jgi:high frequency lysogenization protein
MNQSEPDYRSLALAGVFQAADLVRAAANGLPLSESAADAVIGAITTQNADALADVFPDPGSFRSGLEATAGALSGEHDRADVLRYALQLIELARRLKKSPVVIERLTGGLARLGSQPEAVALAGLYQDTISTLGKRIQVTGDPAALQRPGVADKIRALLLAGVRFAWLWQQLGGSRWQLILNRKQTLAAIEALSHQL